MFKNLFKVSKEENEGKEINKKRQIENIIVFIIILIITVIIINNMWSTDDTESKENKSNSSKVLAETNASTTTTDDLETKLEDILESINGVGKVKVLITYSQTSQTVPMYNEDTSQKDTEETDTSGGTRKIIETDVQKEIIYQETDGEKTPITQSVVSPKVEGAIITAQGATDTNIKANIIQAVEAVTGISSHKIQVFAMVSEN